MIKILPETRYFILQEIFYPSSSVRFFSDKFNNNWSNKEICPICRLRPMKENFDRCKHCLDRRIGQAENWIGQTQKQTIWLDESSDHNDRVALLVGCFILDNWLNGSFIKTMAIAIRNNVPTPKHPSPARIRRCWETTQEFIKNTVLDGIVKNYSYAEGSPHIELRNKRIKFTISPSPNIPKGSTIDIDIDGVRLSPVCIDKSNGVFISTTNLQILSNKGKTVDEIASWMNRKETKIKKENESKWQGEYCISNASPAELKFQDYLPYVPIYDFPDQFMVLVPAYDAMEVAKKIVDAYEIHFSKVRDRLPFHLGLIAFHRRTPLYVAMDAGKRLVETFRRKTKTINARVDAITQVQDSELGNYVKKITLNADPCYSSVPLVWQMSYSTGDPAQEDEWHPYIRVNGNPNRGDYSFDYDGNGNHVVHVKELQPNDCVKIETSYLKITFFETASDRFKVDEKLLPLDDLKRLDEIWSDIQSIISSKRIDIAQIYAFWQEFKKRYEEYSGDLVWESFVKSSLTNIFKLSPTKDSELFNKLFQATKDGLLDLCLYWNLQVRKIKPEEQEVK
ncbi:MAG: CRISPR-associated protein Csx11 [Acidobacteriota bacterium]|nr:CRISPR-associated protein Csx11 [Acidobacteriota bacterium]